MAIKDNWGQGSVNNNNGWGKGASNSSNGWGGVHGNSYGHPTTNLVGGPGFVGLLDQVPGAAAAWSERVLAAAFQNEWLWHERRDSDNDEVLVLPDATGWRGNTSTLLDPVTLNPVGTTYADFYGSSDMRRVATRNQVGLENMEMPTASRQPITVENGAISTIAGRPVANKVDDTTNMISNYNPNSNNALQTISVVVQILDQTDNSYTVFGSESGGGDYGFVTIKNSTSSLVNNFPIVTNEFINSTAWNYNTRDDVYNDLKVHSNVFANIEFNFDDPKLGLGYRTKDNAGFNMLPTQELIVWNADVIGSRGVIETNTQNAFNITP